MVYVRRARLASAIAGSAVTVVEAPSGYGKTSLAIEAAEAADLDLVRVVAPPSGSLLDEVRRGLAAVGLSRTDLDQATSPSGAAVAVRHLLVDPETPPLLVFVDEVQRADGVGVELLRELSLSWIDPHRLVVAGRRAPTRLAATARLSQADLAFDLDEFVAVVEQPDWRHDPQVGALVERLGGWPAALSLIRSPTPGNIVGGDTARSAERIVDDLVADLLRDLDEHSVALIEGLAHLPAFGPSVAEALGGPSGWVAAQVAGLPMVATGDGWFRFSDPVTERLRRRRPLGPEGARQAAAAFAATGDVRRAVDVLVTNGLVDDAATLLSELRLREIGWFQPAELRAIEALLAPGALSLRAQLVVQRARLDAIAGAIAERAELLAEAHRLASEAGDWVTVAAAEAEQVSDLARTSRPEAALALAATVLERIGGDHPRVRATCLAGAGLAEATRTGGDRRVARDHLVEAVTLFHGLGAVSEEAGAKHWLAYWVWYMDGRIDDALDAMRSVLGALDPASGQRGVLATFLGEMLAAAGDADGALRALEDAFRIGRSRGDGLTLAYASWVAAEAATVAGDASRVRLHVDELERSHGDWWEHSTGTDMLSDISQMYRRLGDRDGAERYLLRVADRSEGSVPTRRFAEAAFGAEHGEPIEALRVLDQLDAEGSLFAVHRPRLMAMGAVACQRSGDVDDAVARWSAAQGEAARLGVPDLLDRVEPTLVARMSGVSPDRADRLVRLLGGFGIVVDGLTVAVPAGRGSTLVKALALAGRPLTLDEILEMLWPDEDPGVARRRLRNLLNRIRDEGVDVVVRTSTGLALSPGFDTDVAAFEHAASAALESGDTEAARHAVALYRGELLPDDRYDDWCALPREQLRRRHLELVDRLIADAERRGDVDRVLELTDRALEGEPFDERRAVLAATVAWKSGRRGQAVAFARRARAIVEDLGLASVPEIDAILAQADPSG